MRDDLGMGGLTEMYSVILMAAMTTAAPETPSWGGCHGHPRSVGSCYGGLWLYGSCTGGNCYGCYGSSWGGCTGCWGWGGCYGCSGCYGSCYGSWSGYANCCGCYGSWGSWASPYPTTYPSGNPMVTPPGRLETAPPPKKEGEAAKTTSPPTAKLIIETPANAKLYVDDVAMTPAAGPRVFTTPALDPSQAYYYQVRVETQIDGKPVTESRQVIVRAGETTRATFTEATAQAAQPATGISLAGGGR
jgi:uncharacterized protein (TIGR03000 family)